MTNGQPKIWLRHRWKILNVFFKKGLCFFSVYFREFVAVWVDPFFKRLCLIVAAGAVISLSPLELESLLLMCFLYTVCWQWSVLWKEIISIWVLFDGWDFSHMFIDLMHWSDNKISVCMFPNECLFLNWMNALTVLHRLDGKKMWFWTSTSWIG